MKTAWPSGRGKLSHLGARQRLALMLASLVILISMSSPSLAMDASAVTSQLITLNLAQTDVRTVFMAIGALAGLNTVIDPAVQGTVSVSLQNVPLETALQTVAMQAGVKVSVVEQMLTVTPLSSQVIKETKATTGYARVYALQYADVDKVKEIATTVVPDIRISGDNLSRRIVAVGTAQDLDLLEGFLEMFDKAGRQVLIEARVEEVSSTAIKRLGITWTLPKLSSSGDLTTGNTPWTMAGLSATLDALETQGESHLLARPQITTVSGETAPIFVGDQIPIVLKGAEGEGESISYIEAGIRLEIEPRISPGGTITAHVNLEVSSIAEWTAQGMPVVRTRRAETTVQVEDGQPIIIGGLIKQEEQASMARIPLLGSLPVVGSLFRWNRTDGVQMETVIILTPHLLPEAGATTTSATTPSATPTANPLGLDTPGATNVAPLSSLPSLQPKFSLSTDLAAAGSGGRLQIGLGYSRAAQKWWEAQVTTSYPVKMANEWRIGAMYRTQEDDVYTQAGAFYIPSAGLPPKWEAEGSMGLSFNLKLLGWPLFFEPTMRLCIPFGPSADDPTLEFGLILAYRS